MQRLGDFIILTVAALTLALTTTAAEELRSNHFLDQTNCKNDIFEDKFWLCNFDNSYYNIMAQLRQFS